MRRMVWSAASVLDCGMPHATPPARAVRSESGSMNDIDTPVRLQAVDAPDQPDVTPALEDLYRGFEQELLVPLWTEIGDLMPAHPRSRAVPHLWRWDTLRRARRAGRRARPGRPRRRAPRDRPGQPVARRSAVRDADAVGRDPVPDARRGRPRAPPHPARVPVRRRGRGRVDVVGGDPVPMRRGDFLPQAGWNWHAHHNATAEPMAWIDGLDIPFQYVTEAQFFEFGRDQISDAERTTPDRSRSERLWGHPGLRPLSATQPDARVAAAGLQVGVHRPRARRPARDRGRGVRRHRRTRPRRRPLHQPGDRRRRAAHDPRRDAPRRPRRRDRPGPRDRLVGLSGLRRLRHRHGRRHDLDRHPRRPVRRPVVGAVLRAVRGRRRPTPTPAPSTCSASATRPSSRRSSSTGSQIETIKSNADEARHDPHADGTRAVRLEDDRLVDLGAADVGELLARPELARDRPAPATT